LIDEIGPNLLARIANKNANSHEAAMKPFLARTNQKALTKGTLSWVHGHSPARSSANVGADLQADYAFRRRNGSANITSALDSEKGNECPTGRRRP
jgi:hypothetical protein